MRMEPAEEMEPAKEMDTTQATRERRARMPINDLDWFTNWLEAQRSLQLNAYGVEPAKENPDYVHAMITGLFTEVGELAAEIDWKYWSSGRGNFNREQVIGEAVDALHFLGNILLWAGVTGQELTEAYLAKMDVNLERQEQGYDALADKCIVCGREIDKTGDCVRGHAVPRTIGR